MMRIRKRWRYIGWACVAVAAFWVAMLIMEIASRM